MTGNKGKPNGGKAGWQLRGSESRFENEIFRLREDAVEVDGKKIKYAYVERADAVIVVPVTAAGEIVILKQYRYAVDEWCLEIPAGGTHDTCDAALEDVVRKELREEIGGTAKSIRYVDYFYSANALTDEKCHVFLAEGVELTNEQETESTESIEVKLVPAGEAVALAQNGKMKTGPCALALLLCAPLLKRSAHGQLTPNESLET
ncbi:MAG: NUDIX domain-containing protein [Chthoniobacterales bacterium]